MARFLPIFIPVLGLLWNGPVLAESSVKVADAWIRGIPPGLKVTAGYLVLRNEGGNARTVSAVSSPAFRAVEMHETAEREDGTSTMYLHRSLDIDSGETLAFKPHGYHLMMFDPLEPILPGKRIPVVLTLWDGTRLEFEAEVRK